jgi:ribonuclease P protein component
VLPAVHRMRRSQDFTAAVRRGRRSGSPHLVAHLLLLPPSVTDVTTTPRGPELPRDLSMPTPPPARVGFVVSKAVGIAVVRTRVKRRLRAVVVSRLDRLPAGSLLVIRANPLAAQANSADLAASLDRALGRLLPRAAVGA